LEILYLKSVDSTHTYLKNYIKNNNYAKPFCVTTQYQTQGIGSRDNSWNGVEGNLFFSFVIDKEMLPSDLPIQSSSIYFSFILKELLVEHGSNVWLKWPNDFYINDKKIGGTITNLSNDLLYCGIGLNLNFVEKQFGFLDVQIDIKDVLEEYFRRIEEEVLWKHIFSKYSIEFTKSKEYTTTIDNQNNSKSKKSSLKNATLNSDGSINIENKKVFSLR